MEDLILIKSTEVESKSTYTKREDEMSSNQSVEYEYEVEVVREELIYSEFTDSIIDQEINLKYQIKDVAFDLFISDGSYELSHPAWSLSGKGESLISAEKNLIEEANDIADFYLSAPMSSLDFNAQDLRDFLLKVCG